ncbi:MAG: carboxymuconolactone decarboxylase family protein [Aeromicrobium sp.]
MSRIPAVAPAEAGLLVRIAYRIARRRFGGVPEPFGVTAHHRGLFLASAMHELGVERVTRVMPKQVLELAVYRTAWTVGCSWCVDFGTMVQRLDGLDVERLKHIADFETSDAYSDEERDAIRYADAMTSTPMTVTDDQVAALVDRYGNDGVVELTYQISLENQRARFNHALGITDQGFGSGETCRVPWDVNEPETSRA